jgi:hypothetical protein
LSSVSLLRRSHVASRPVRAHVGFAALIIRGTVVALLECMTITWLILAAFALLLFERGKDG